MSIAATQGFERDLGAGVRRSLVVLADISTASELLQAGESRRRIVNAELDFSGPGQVEIKAGSTSLWYRRLAGAAGFRLSHDDLIISATAGPLTVEASAAMTVDGFIDWQEQV